MITANAQIQLTEEQAGELLTMLMEQGSIETFIRQGVLLEDDKPADILPKLLKYEIDVILRSYHDRLNAFKVSQMGAGALEASVTIEVKE